MCFYKYSYNQFLCTKYILRPHKRAGVAQSVQSLTTDWTAGFRSPTEADDFSSGLCAQPGSGAHPASCTMGTGGSFPGGKARPGRDAEHSPPSSAEVKKEQELYLLSPKAPPWRGTGPLYLFSFDLTKFESSFQSESYLWFNYSYEYADIWFYSL
jgi:hypothetical protein